MEPSPANFPDEIWVNILSHLSSKDIIAVSSVSRNLRRIAADHAIWKKIFQTLGIFDLLKEELVFNNCLEKYMKFSSWPLLRLGKIVKISQLNIPCDGVGVQKLIDKQKMKKRAYCFLFDHPSRLSTTLTYNLIKIINIAKLQEHNNPILHIAIDEKEGKATSKPNIIGDKIQWGIIIFEKKIKNLFINTFNEEASKMTMQE